MSILFLFIIAVCLLAYAAKVSRKNKADSVKSQNTETPNHFNLLDDNGEPVQEPKVKIVIGSDDSDAPVQELQYFCIKDKGYHVSVWPKDHDQFDVVQFNIAGISYCEGVDKYLGEFVGVLMAEPDNPYDPNAIKVLTGDGHHVGYVPKDMTSEVREETTLPCYCYCYIGVNDTTYFSCCYILRKE